MHRISGKKVNTEYYIEVEKLPDGQLFSAQEITSRKFDRKEQKNAFYRMSQALYRFGERNGLTIKPDNCERDAENRPITHKGKVLLKGREKRPRWYGKTWKSKLCIEDKEAILAYARHELLLALMIAYEEKLKNADQSTALVLVKKGTICRKKETKTKKVRWLIGLAALLTIFLVTIWQIKTPEEARSPEVASFARYVQTKSRPKPFLLTHHEHPEITSLKLDFLRMQRQKTQTEFFATAEKPSLLYSRLSLLQ